MSLTLLSRPDCGLCEEMLAELQALRSRAVLPPVTLVDVGSDPLLQRRFGLKIPVLMLDGAPICHARLDERKLLAALARRT